MQSLHSTVIYINDFFNNQELLDLDKFFDQTLFLLQHSGWLQKISTNLIMNDGRLHSGICRESKPTLFTVDDLPSNFFIAFFWNLELKPTIMQFCVPSFSVSIALLNIFTRVGCVSGICYYHQEVLNYTETIVYNQVICAVFPNYTSKNLKSSQINLRGDYA
jgi:hypothetical protein